LVKLDEKLDCNQNSIFFAKPTKVVKGRDKEKLFGLNLKEFQ